MRGFLPEADPGTSEKMAASRVECGSARIGADRLGSARIGSDRSALGPQARMERRPYRINEILSVLISVGVENRPKYVPVGADRPYW